MRYIGICLVAAATLVACGRETPSESDPAPAIESTTAEKRQPAPREEATTATPAPTSNPEPTSTPVVESATPSPITEATPTSPTVAAAAPSPTVDPAPTAPPRATVTLAPVQDARQRFEQVMPPQATEVSPTDALKVDDIFQQLEATYQQAQELTKDQRLIIESTVTSAREALESVGREDTPEARKQAIDKARKALQDVQQAVEGTYTGPVG